MFPIKNGLKQGDTLLPLLFKFAVEYTIRCVEQSCNDEIEFYTSASG